MKFPYWYLNQKFKMDLQLEEKEWNKLIDERILLLEEKNRKDREYGLENYEKVEMGKKEIQAFTIMKIGVCMDPRLSSWLVEFEGDLFETDFRSLKWSEKIPILNDLYPHEDGKVIWMTLDDLSIELNEDLKSKLSIKEETMRNYQSHSALLPSARVKDVKGVNKYIALDFRYATQLVKERKAILYRGWVITQLSKLIITIKHKYQDGITKSLAEFADRLENVASSSMKRISKEVNENLQEKIKFIRSRVEIDNLELVGGIEDNMSILPPCIDDLMIAVNEVGYIGHWERLQLGIFLKKVGMHIDDQLKFWYGKAVDNVNMSYDDFVRKAGYVIRHIYGLEGGKVDYQMPACSTIQDKMYCTFRHRGIEHINKRMVSKLSVYGDNTTQNHKLLAKRVIEASIRGLPSQACAYHLDLITGTTLDKVTHPLFYLKIAGEKIGKIRKDEDGSDKKLDVDGSDKKLDVDGSDKKVDVDGSDKKLDVDGSDKKLDTKEAIISE